MKSSASGKMNIIQSMLHIIQSIFYVIQWCKKVATIKVRQFIVVKDYALFIVTFMSDIKMAIRWISAKQGAITERVSSAIASWLPMVSFPSPIGAFEVVGTNQNFATVGAKSLLPLPSVFYSGLRKSRHSRTSQAGHFVNNVYVSRIKNGWESWEDGEWYRLVDGKSIDLIILKRTPIRGWDKGTRVTYNVFYHGRDIGHAYTLAKARQIGDKALRQKRK